MHHEPVDLFGRKRLSEDHDVVDIPFEYPAGIGRVGADRPGAVIIIAQTRLAVGITGFHPFAGDQPAINIQIFIRIARDAGDVVPVAVPAGGGGGESFMSFPAVGIKHQIILQ